MPLCLIYKVKVHPTQNFVTKMTIKAQRKKTKANNKIRLGKNRSRAFILRIEHKSGSSRIPFSFLVLSVIFSVYNSSFEI